jgi:hypothetical protein
MCIEPRRVTVTSGDVIQDGVVLNITTDEAIRSILARIGWPSGGEYVGGVLSETWLPVSPVKVWATFVLNDVAHEIGNAACDTCWSGYPENHRCGGLLHGAFEDESWDEETGDEDVYLVYGCDRCGDPY